MFNDDFEKYQRQIEKLFDTYELEELLEMNDMSAAEALTYLYLEGLIELPNMQPLSFDA